MSTLGVTPMQDFRSFLAGLRRPRLLVRAARHGLQDYRRDRDLGRLIQARAGVRPEAALEQLFETEEALEATRRAGDATYSIARHIEVLIAMMAEARLLPHRTAV
ncbi:MAG: DUF6477 family protein [Gemmobacter sp.]